MNDHFLLGEANTKVKPAFEPIKEAPKAEEAKIEVKTPLNIEIDEVEEVFKK